MLKASALYLVIVIALIIAVLSGTLLTTAFFYRSEHQKSLRYIRLINNLDSGIEIILSRFFLDYDKELQYAIQAAQNDVSLRMEPWGLYDLGLVKSYVSSDTLKKSFLFAKRLADSTVLYVSDEDRPVSVSGSTRIEGDAYLPKAGIRQAYVEGKPYSGSRTVYGKIKVSSRMLPELDVAGLKRIKTLYDTEKAGMEMTGDSIRRSFFDELLLLKIDPQNANLSRCNYSGKILIQCDTMLTIAKTARLKDVIVIAPAVRIEGGFSGVIQVFAKDSISTGPEVNLQYPSAMVVLRHSDSGQPRIVLGERSNFAGIMISYEAERSPLQTMISLGKDSKVEGELYATGIMKLDRPLSIKGKVSCTRFVLKTASTLYENYLIDVSMSRPQLSRYFLGSALLNKSGSKREVLKWLD